MNRLGRWLLGRVLRQNTGGACLRCGTDFRWVAPHDTPFEEETGRCAFPLCEGCWQHLSPESRLPYYAVLLSRWRQEGRYEGRPDRWNADRVAVYAAVQAGL